MSIFNPFKLIVFALIFLSVFFWVQTFYAYWRLFNERDLLQRNVGSDNEASSLATFSLILTIVTVVVSYLYQPYGKSLRLKDMPEEPEDLNGISDEELLGMFSL